MCLGVKRQTELNGYKMPNSLIIKDNFGKHYALKTIRDPITPSSLKAETFSDLEFTRIFVDGLDIPHDYWSSILESLNIAPSQRSYQGRQILHQISELFLDGTIRLYPVKNLNSSENNVKNRAIKTSNNVTYTFSPASTLLTSSPREVKYFPNRRDAEKFLAELAPDEEKLKMLATELEVKAPKTASSNPTELSAAIATALVDRSVIVMVDRVSSPPKVEKLESAPGPGSQVVDLPPASESAPAEPANDDSLVDDNQKSQAETLVQASEEGTPLCEVCEQAKAS